MKSEENDMTAWKFVDIAKAAVVNHVNACTNEKIIDMEDVDIIWMHQTEHANRAILTLIPPAGTLYEVTYTKPNKLQLSNYTQVQTVNIPL